MRKDTECKCDVREAVNFGDRAKRITIDTLLLHYTGMHSPQAAVNWLCSEESKVSCHYLVFEHGGMLQMVPEEKRAWHAGQASWQGETDINSKSIGIEIVNRGHQLDYPDFPEAQIAAVIKLCKDILSRHDIPQRNVLAHSDVAPMRKPDPGEKFPWARLKKSGIGHWVPEQEADYNVSMQIGDNSETVAAYQAMLSLYGYEQAITGDYDRKTHFSTVAFQRHFRQSRIDGIADSNTVETLEQLIKAL
ncbi:MAG: N-acetylmuramoyl-L-alanine amidase [Pseudomonadota bacterium]